MKIINKLFKASNPEANGGGKMGNGLKLIFLPLLAGILLLALAGIGQATLTLNVTDGSSLVGIVHIGASSTNTGMTNITNCSWFVWTTATGVRQNTSSTNQFGFTIETTVFANESVDLVTNTAGATGLEEANLYNLKAICYNFSGTTSETSTTVTGLIVDNKDPGSTATLYYPTAGTIYDNYDNQTVVLRAKVNDSGSHVQECIFKFNSSAGPVRTQKSTADSSGVCSVTYRSFPNYGTYYWYVELSDGTDTTIGKNSSYFTINYDRRTPGQALTYLNLFEEYDTSTFTDNKGLIGLILVIAVIGILSNKKYRNKIF